MAGVADSAVGAILEIPDSALRNIEKAERAIKQLALSSAEAAGKVNDHWGVVAPSGLQKFIDKIAEAKAKMDGLGAINVTLNTQAAVQSTEHLSSATKKTSTDVSKAVQDMASSWNDLAKVSLKGFDPTDYGNNITEIKLKLKELKKERDSLFVKGSTNQALVDEIRQIEEYIRLYKLATVEKNKALSNAQQKQQSQTDKAYLDEQKRLLAEILDLRKQVNGQKIVVAQGQVTGSSTLEQDKKILTDLIARLYEAKDKLKEYNAEKYKNVSTEGQAKAQINTLNQENALIKEQISFRDKLNAAIARGNELTAQTQANKARLGNSDESVAQRQLNTDYKEMLKIIKEYGEVRAKAASEGRNMTQQEYTLVQTLIDRYRIFKDDISRVASSYTNMAQASAQAFQNDKSAQLARNAMMLADAKNKAAKSEMSESQTISRINKIYRDRISLLKEIEKINTRGQIAVKNGLSLSSQETAMISQLRSLYLSLEQELDAIKQKKLSVAATTAIQEGELAYTRASIDLTEKRIQAIQREEDAINKSRALERIRKYTQEINSYQGAMRAYGNLGKYGGQWENTFENRARVIKNLEAAIKSLKTTDADYERKLKDLTDAMNRLKSAQDAVKNSMKPIVSPQDAMNMAKNASTLRELEAAYKALKTAMSNTNTSDPRWTQMNGQLEKTKTSIDNIKKKMGEFQSQSSKTANVLGQLKGRIAAAFSVGAITGFIKKMVDVRAQFELQRVALGAIIQDRDEANKIFTQVQNMALESPFSIMQLETATKQIAAFGFETKKIVPTMKMFADISAGLGVEIDRLVLVMGHLKARNFLEGTMVRQFTNMGFNVLGELAKYYSELENKMVSVGEVQDRVKKKMISFEDVEEVLKRVTSAGGMFYDMQKKQSDSLWGQLQRINDAYNLMLNEIGQSNEGVIKAMLTVIRALINSWRTLKPYIVAAVAAMGTYFTTAALMKGIPLILTNIAKGFASMRTAITGAKIVNDGLNASMMKNPYAAVLTTVVALIVVIIELATAQDKLTEAMDRVRNEGIGNMYDLIYQYQKLADTVRDTTKPYEEQKKALDEIKRIYADILPAEMLEIENIKKMSKGYEEATSAIKAYSAEKIKANLKTEIENIVGKDIQEEETGLADRFIRELKNFGNLPKEMPKDTLRSIVRTMIAEISEEVKSGSLPAENAVNELQKRMVEKLQNLIPNGEAVINRFFEIIANTAGYKNVLRDFETQTNGIDIGIKDAESEELVIIKDRYEQLTKAVDEYKKAIEALRLAKEAGQITGDMSQDKDGKFVAANDGQMGQKVLDNFNQALDNVDQKAQKLGVTWSATALNVNAAIESQTGQMIYFEKVNNSVFGNVLAGFNRWSDRFKNDKSVAAWVKNAVDGYDRLDLSPLQRKISDVAATVVTANGMQIKSLDKLRLQSLNSFGDAAKAAQNVYNQLAANEIAIQTQIKSLIKYGYSAAQAKALAEAEFGAGMSSEEIKEMMNLYKELIPAFGGTFKDPNKSKSKKSTDTELKRWQDLKKAIEDVSTAYDKYRKSFTVEESNKRIEELYGPAFKELGRDIKQFYKDGKYDSEGLINALEVLKGMTKATTEERKKFRSEIERKIGVTQVEIEVKMKEDAEEKLKANFDDMFTNYELSEEFKKIGLNVDLIYMVGGKPTTRQDIRNEIARLRAEGGGSEDAENQIKILEEAEKKITQIELKNQKERLKNYEKYLKTMYSDRAKTMIESYTTLSQMEEDFQKNIQQLESEMNAPDTTDARKKELAGLIASLRNQASEAAIGIQRELSEALAKADWNSFKGSEIFESMYQDLDTLSKKGIDALIQRLEDVRNKLQSVSDIDPKAVREVTQYIEKLKDARINFAPYAGFKEALSAAKELKKEYGSIEAAQLKLVELNDSALGYEQEVADLETIISLLDRKVAIEGGDAATTARLNALYDKYKANLQDALATARKNMAVTKEQASALGATVNNAKKLGVAYQAQISNMQKYKESVGQITNAVFEIADALGGTVDEEWKNLANSIIDATFQGIQLQLQMQILQVQAQLLGVAMNSALGIIGWVATALQVVASLLTAIFAAKDKRLQKKIEALQDRVDVLSKAFEKLEKSIERAFSIGQENRMTEDALDNIEQQKKAYEEMIRLEEAKKKTDDDKIKEYKDKLDELAEAEEELYEKRHEKWGSTNDVWSEANNWVDAWLDAYKEIGDGLDSLNESWDEFYENLVKKQATSAIVGKRMQGYIDRINNVIDSNMDEYGYVDAFKEIGESFKADSAEWNKLLKEFFEYAGIGGAGNLILSDLQKGIQNITEPQAAAIEAYLNSMRFAVFSHTEQLDTLIATIQQQYGNGAENPVVTELKGIRNVLDSINSKFDSIIGRNGSQRGIRIAT